MSDHVMIFQTLRLSVLFLVLCVWGGRLLFFNRSFIENDIANQKRRGRTFLTAYVSSGFYKAFTLVMGFVLFAGGGTMLIFLLYKTAVIMTQKAG